MEILKIAWKEGGGGGLKFNRSAILKQRYNYFF